MQESSSLAMAKRRLFKVWDSAYAHPFHQSSCHVSSDWCLKPNWTILDEDTLPPDPCRKHHPTSSVDSCFHLRRSKGIALVPCEIFIWLLLRRPCRMLWSESTLLGSYCGYCRDWQPVYTSWGRLQCCYSECGKASCNELGNVEE